MQPSPPNRPTPTGGKTTGSIPQQKPATGKVPAPAPKPASAAFDADNFLVLDADAAPAKSAAPPSRTGTTGTVPAAGTARVPTVPPRTGTTGQIPVAAPKTGTTGRIPAASPPKTGTTGQIPAAAPKTGTTGRVPVAAPPKTGTTGPIPTAVPAKTGGTSRIPTVPGRTGTTGQIPVAAPPKAGGTSRIQTLPGRTGTTGTIPVTGRPGSSGRIPQAGGKTTGGIPKLTDTGRLRTTTGRVRSTRTGRTAHVSQRLKKQAKKGLRLVQAVVAILGGLIVVGGGGYLLVPKGKGISPEDKNYLLNKISDCLAHYDSRRFVESDKVYHDVIDPLIAKLPQHEDEELREATRKIKTYHDSEIHPTAAAETEAEKVFAGWLPKVDEYLKLPDPRPADEGVRLYDIGFPAMQKYPRYSRADEVAKKIEVLEQYKVQIGGNVSRNKFVATSREIRPLVRDKAYGPAIQKWVALKGDAEVTDDQVKKEIDEQISRLNELAKFQLDKWTREAEQQRDDYSNKDAGQKILDEAREKLKGSDIDKEVEERVKGYQAGKKFGI